VLETQIYISKTLCYLLVYLLHREDQYLLWTMNLYSAFSSTFMYVFLPLRTKEKLKCNLPFEWRWDMIIKYQTYIVICCIKLQGSQTGGEPSSPLMSYLNWMWAGNFWRNCCSLSQVIMECTTCQSCLHWNFLPRLLPMLLHIHFVWLPPWTCTAPLAFSACSTGQ
jgi:hypothetical protein